MATPSLSNNTPSPGHISWPEFVIRYEGAAYTVSAASTDQRWVWWEYNSGMPTISAGPEVPATLTEDDLLLFGNKNGLGIRVQNTNLIDGELLVEGSIFAEAIAANQVSTQHIITEGLDAAVIKFGTMAGERIEVATLNGDRIIAKTLGVSKLVVGDFNNYIADGYVDDPELQNWTGGAMARVDPAGEVAYISWATATANVGATRYNENVFELAPGDEYVFSCEISTPGNSVSVGFRAGIETRNGDGAVVANTLTPETVLSPNVGWIAHTGTIKIPAGTSIRGQFNAYILASAVGQQIRVRKMMLLKKANGSLIVDGTLKAKALEVPVIEANEIYSQEGYFGTIEADKIISGELGADVVLAGSLLIGSSIRMTKAGGIVITQANGGKIVFPANGGAASIASHLDAFSLTVQDRLKIQGLQNEISSSSKVTLAAGVSPPTKPPVMDIDWNRFYASFAGGFEATIRGLTRHHGGGGWIAACSFFGSSLRYVDANGANGVTYNLQPKFNADGGVVYYNNRYYVLGWDENRENRWFVMIYDTTFTKVGEWEYGWGVNSTKRPAIGIDATNNLVIAQANTASAFFRVSTFTIDGTLTSGGTIGSSVVQCDIPAGANADAKGVLAGNFDLGTATIFVANESGFLAYNTSGTRQSSREFIRAGSDAVLGFHWDGTRFRHYDTKGYVWVYETGATDLTRSVAYSWYDSDTGGTGVHETATGSAVTYVQNKRSRMVVNTGTPNDLGANDDPDSVRVWINGNRQPDLGVGITVANYGTTISTGTTSKAADFPATATAAILNAFNGGFTIDGSSNGSVGTGSFRESVREAVATDYRRVRAGSASTGTLAANTPVDVPITFTTQFPSTVDPANIIVTTGIQSPGTVNPLVMAANVVNGSITRTGCTIRAVRSTGTAGFTVTYAANVAN